MLAVEKTPILPTDTAATLEPRLAAMGPRLVIAVLEDLRSGRAVGVPQDPALVTRSPKLRKEQGRIDWTRSAREIDCQVRGLQPWPVADTLLPRPGKPSLRCAVLEVAVLSEIGGGEVPGTVLDRGKSRLVVATGGRVDRDSPTASRREATVGRRRVPARFSDPARNSPRRNGRLKTRRPSVGIIPDRRPRDVRQTFLGEPRLTAECRGVLPLLPG